VVAKGKVYVVTQSNQLQVSGLLSAACDANQDGAVNVDDVQSIIDDRHSGTQSRACSQGILVNL
jgi:hypothetical protein